MKENLESLLSAGIAECRMYSKEEGVRNLDRILLSRASSSCSLRRPSQASEISRHGSNISARSVNSARSPLPLDVSEKEWFLSASQCQMGKLKDLLTVNSQFIDKKDFFTGYSALHWAAKEGRSELLHWLCDSGADVNSKSNGGYTPLHLAVMHGRALIVDILTTDYDADINTRDYSGKKPGHYAQSDMPTWVQRALRTNQKATDGLGMDALVMSTNANIAAMSKQQLSRSWNSFRYENKEEKTASDRREKEGSSTSRTKSILRSFRKVRNKDRMHHSREAKEHVTRARESESKERQRHEERSRSVPDICLTPRSRKKLLQIEHPHFDDTMPPHSDDSGDTETIAKGSQSGRSSSEIDDVFDFEQKRDDLMKINENSRKEETNCSNKNDDISIKDNEKAGEINKRSTGLQIEKDLEGTVNHDKKAHPGMLTDVNANQWKTSTVV